MTELDALDPVPEQVKLASGTVVQIENLRARQFFKFLRILTHSAVPAMSQLFRSDVDAQEFGINLLTVTMLSIPDSEDEAVEFIRSMCKPVGLIERRQLNKADTERNDDLWRHLDDELENPELDDLVTIVEAIVKRESEDIQALGKRLAAMFKLAEKTGQVPPSPSPTTPTGTSSEDSAAPSTSSRANTTGTTTESETSPSGGSAKSSRRSGNAASTPTGAENNS